MPKHTPRLDEVSARKLHPAFDRIREKLSIDVDFAPSVEEAAASAATGDRPPAADRTDLELVTIDPPGAMDLDQALHIATDGDGYVVSYAIADVGAFVSPGDRLDAAARERAETYYAPDGRAPLYPTSLSEDAASLLPGQDRPALLWTLRLDGEGALTDTALERATVRSRARLDYQGVQDDVDAGRASTSLQLLATVGALREQVEVDRGGVSLPLPEQEVEAEDGGETLRLVQRSQLPVEGFNAQISLLTGIAAAQVMIEGHVGLLRTLPPANDRALARLRRVAKAVKVPWPGGQSYAAFIHSLDPTDGRHLAVMTAATGVFRGAGYAAFDGDLPAEHDHAALATPYAHVTAPLRRLGDRYANAVLLALTAGQRPDEDVVSALPDVAKAMQAGDGRAHQLERRCLDVTEAALLQHRVGEVFDATVVELDGEHDHGRPTAAAKEQRGELWLTDLPVVAAVTGRNLPLGEPVRAKLASADPATGSLAFVLA